MTQPTDPFAPAIGACLSCRQLFLVTPETPNCILCGRPPAYSLPFGNAHPEPVEGPETPSEAPIGELDITEGSHSLAEEQPPAATEEPAEEAPETIKASELLPVIIVAFLEGDLAADAETLRSVFEDAGAEPEAASTAVGRLQAVRELIEDLRRQGVAVTVETSEAPAENPAAPAPGA